MGVCVESAGVTCDSTCQTCTGPLSTDCTNCASNRVKVNGECVCPTSYVWNDIEKACVVDCGSLSPALTAVSTNVCQCSAPTYWDLASLSCKLDCSKVVNSNGANGLTACFCISGYNWNGSTCAQTNIDCRQFSNTNGTNNGSTACFCQPKYVWTSASLTCALDCKSIINSSKIFISSTACGCITSYIWHQPTTSCVYVVNCTAMSFANPTLTTTPYSLNCTCISKFFWNYTVLSC